MNLTALSGMRAADLILTTTADNVANLDTPDHRAARVDLAAASGGGVSAAVSRAADPGVDLVDQVAALMGAELLYGANARVLRTQAAMERSLLDIRA